MPEAKSIYKVAIKKHTVPTATAFEVRLPQGSKEHLFRLEASATEFRVAETEAGASTGLPFETPESVVVEGPVERQSLWFYQASGGDLTLHWSYLHPSIR